MTAFENIDRETLHSTNSDERRATMQAGDRARLREIRIQSRSGKPMRHPDHLHAALAFGHLYRKATSFHPLEMLHNARMATLHSFASASKLLGERPGRAVNAKYD